MSASAGEARPAARLESVPGAPMDQAGHARVACVYHARSWHGAEAMKAVHAFRKWNLATDGAIDMFSAGQVDTPGNAERIISYFMLAKQHSDAALAIQHDLETQDELGDVR